MELFAIEKFLCGKVSYEVPTEPGLYLYINDLGLDEYPLVDLVEVRQYGLILMADSDTWETYIPVSKVAKACPGIWTRRLMFVEEFEA